MSRKTMSSIAFEELKRREDLESLRKYLILEQCFPAHKDPETASITMEELKKMARIWKLNERRNFWKMHAERDAMVAALMLHAQQNQNYFLKKSMNKINQMNNGTSSVSLRPSPPKEQKFSVQRAFKNYFGKRVSITYKRKK